MPFAFPRLQRFETCDVAVAAERNLPEVESAAFVDILRSPDTKSMDEISGWLLSLSKANFETNEQWKNFYQIIRLCPTWLALALIRLFSGNAIKFKAF